MRAKLAKFVVVDAVGLAEQRGSSPWMFVRDLGELAYDRMSTEGAEERLAIGMGIAAPLIGALTSATGVLPLVYAYSGNVVFQLLALWAGEEHNAPLFVLCAVISGGLSGANFPMTAAMVADYYGETNNAINYGSIYAFKALGGSFAGGIAALTMTGTLCGTATLGTRLLLRGRAGGTGRADGRVLLQTAHRGPDAAGGAGFRRRGGPEGQAGHRLSTGPAVTVVRLP